MEASEEQTLSVPSTRQQRLFAVRVESWTMYSVVRGADNSDRGLTNTFGGGASIIGESRWVLTRLFLLMDGLDGSELLA